MNATPSPEPSVLAQTFEEAAEEAVELWHALPGFATKVLLAVVVIFLGMVLLRLGRSLIKRIVNLRPHENVQHTQTLSSLSSSVYSYVIYFVIILVVLSLFGVNVTSLIAVAGVGGIAISLGAQTFIQDVISGFFIWLEGSLSVGDIIEINGLSGTVEAVALRTTSIRNANGNLFIIPNGEIRTIVNMSRTFQKALVDVRCPYEVPLNRLQEILTDEMQKAGEEIDGLEQAPEVLSVLSFEKDCLIIRLAAPCPVKENWRIEREIRTRVKNRFDAEGIVMPHWVNPFEEPKA